MSDAATSYKATVGDIVVAPFPFADSSVSKLRSAVIVSTLPHDACLVMYITSATTAEPDFDIVLDPMEVNNLKVTSRLRVNRMLVMPGEMIVRQLGVLTPEERRDVSQN